MFIMTTRLTRSKLVGAVLAGGLLLCAFIILAANRDAPTGPASAPSSGRLLTNDSRLAFIASLGWDAKPEPEEEKEVLIPETFDDVYKTYNNLQLSQGFDLTRYAGKRVMQYTYRIRNYPESDSTVFLSMLVYNNRVIGGDVHSTALDGFMRGLKRNG